MSSRTSRTTPRRKTARPPVARPIELEPDAGQFARAYDAGRPQVVWTRLVSDLETPVSAYLKIASGRPMSFLLESVEGGATRGRYSMIGLAPDIVWRADGNVAEINRSPATKPDAFKREPLPTLAALRALLAESAIELPEAVPPMAAGVFGYMGYDTIRLVEHLPAPRPDVLGVPDMILMRPTVVVIFDSVKDEMTVVTPVRPTSRQSAGKAYAEARKRLAAAVAALEVSLNDATWIITDSVSTTNTPPMMNSTISWRTTRATMPSAAPSASAPTSPMKTSAG